MNNMNTPPRGRLAPSPTGHMHLGNAMAFLLAFAQMQILEGTLLLRLEDIDADRAKDSFIQDILDDLHWLGIQWHEGPDRGGPYAPYVQSQRDSIYQSTLHTLQSAGLVYPCFCTRKELRSVASAPHGPGAAYSGKCRNLTQEKIRQLQAEGKKFCLRLDVHKACTILSNKKPNLPNEISISSEGIFFHDLICGQQFFTWEHSGGDFALCRSDGVFAYQLAVVADDALMQVSHVLRGNDLLDSTARQILLYALLDKNIPQFAHIPLVCDHLGERLAKRHQSLSLKQLRASGTSAEQVLGLISWLCGWQPSSTACSMSEFVQMTNITALQNKTMVIPEYRP